LPANTSPGKTLRRNSTSELVGSYPFGSSAPPALRTQILPGRYGTYPAVRWNRDKFRSRTRWSMSGAGSGCEPEPRSASRRGKRLVRAGRLTSATSEAPLFRGLFRSPCAFGVPGGAPRRCPDPGTCPTARSTRSCYHDECLAPGPSTVKRQSERRLRATGSQYLARWSRMQITWGACGGSATSAGRARR
jgi:hypothetical protein